MDLSVLSDDDLVALFGQEILRRNAIGLVCCIPLGGGDSVFCGSYPVGWADLKLLSLKDQLLYLAAYASVTSEKERIEIEQPGRVM